MAHPEHAELVQRGADAVNAWRLQHPGEPLDLRTASLPEAQLEGANLAGCDLGKADLRGVNLAGADLRGANLAGITAHGVVLSRADLRGADLTNADLRAANFEAADLRAAMLCQADLRAANLFQADARRSNGRGADFRRADLSDANFQEAFLREARFGECRLLNTNFTRACLAAADFGSAIAGGTLWNAVDLSEAKRLESLLHQGPSSVGIDAIYQSRGRVPAAFLRGCGVEEDFIANVPGLASKSLQFYPLLIVHAEEDRNQAEQLAQALKQRGVRCWLNAVSAESDPHAIHRNRRGQKLLFCVSQNWLNQPVAETFAQTVRKLEEQSAEEWGLAEKIWFSADLDGAIHRGDHGKLAEAHGQRLIAKFLPEFSKNGQFQHELENVVTLLTAHPGENAQPTLADQALLELRQLIGHVERLQEGYRKLRHNDGAKNVWFDYRGKQRRSYHIRQLVPGNMMEWETAPVVLEPGRPFCHFCFAGAMGAQNRPPGSGFLLLVNGKPCVPFNLAREEQSWHSPDHAVTLLYSPHWLSRDDSSGFFYVALSQDRLKAGRPCRLGVQVRGKDSPRWFALFPEPQAVLCQADIGKI